MPEDERIITMADRGSLAPQRGEGLRVRGESAQVVGNQNLFLPVPGEAGEGGQFYASVPRNLGEGGSSVHLLVRPEEFRPASLHRVNRILLFFVFWSSIAVSAVAGVSNDPNAAILRQKAQTYLQSLLPSGLSAEDLAMRFGPPRFKYEMPDKEQCAIFMFATANKPAVLRAAHVDGFTAFLANNRMTHWTPVYEEPRPAAADAPVKPVASRFAFDRPRLTFHLVSPKALAGSVFVDNSEFKKLGYINKVPDLAVRSGQFILSDAVPRSTHTIEFVLAPADAEKLKSLTTSNEGKRLAVLFNGQVVSALFVYAPLPDGHVLVNLSDANYWRLSKFLKANTAPGTR